MPFRRNIQEKGFTLIELLIVLVILGLLAALIGPNMIRHTDDAKVTTTKLQIRTFSTSLDAFRLDMGRYPTTDEGLSILVNKPDEAVPGASRWKGPYTAAIAKDGWGNAYQYRAPGEHGDYDIWSYGADNREGGDGYASDIESWNLGTGTANGTPSAPAPKP